MKKSELKLLIKEEALPQDYLQEMDNKVNQIKLEAMLGHAIDIFDELSAAGFPTSDIFEYLRRKTEHAMGDIA